MTERMYEPDYRYVMATALASKELLVAMDEDKSMSEDKLHEALGQRAVEWWEHLQNDSQAATWWNEFHKDTNLQKLFNHNWTSLQDSIDAADELAMLLLRHKMICQVNQSTTLFPETP